MYKVKIQIPTRVDKYLKKLYPVLTQGIIEKYLRLGKIKIDNKKQKACYRLLGDETITFEDRRLNEEIAQYINANDENNQNYSITTTAHHMQQELQVVSSKNVISLSKKIMDCYLLYQDDNFMAIDKPEKLATQGGSKINISIQHAIDYLNYTQKLDTSNQMRLVHRLDKDTSGVLLIAKNYLSAHKLTLAFKDHKIYKTYLAITHNKPEKDEGEIRYKIFDENKKRELDATTKYTLLQTNHKFSLIRFTPLSGRKHQIRIHASFINCPIVGDTKYSPAHTDNNLNACKYNDNLNMQNLRPSILNQRRMFLHAESIAIDEKVFEKKIIIRAKSNQNWRL